MSTFDPDLDTPQTRPRSLPGQSVAEYQRLLANPLLAIVGLIGAWAVLRYSLQIRNLPLFLIALVLTALCPFLIQFHCLDCGRSDFAFRSRRHVCNATLQRMRRDEPARRRPPRLRSQVKAWVWSLLSAVVIYAILAGGRR
jgi:hypothetical protein